MEFIIIILILLALVYAIFKVAKSKNRDPGGWILSSIIISPLIILLILACMPTLKGKKKSIKKRKKLRK